jgi:CubicO group peptidase (beta-lactamase class C family)
VSVLTALCAQILAAAACTGDPGAGPDQPARATADVPALYNALNNQFVVPPPGSGAGERRFHFGETNRAFVIQLPVAVDSDGDGYDEIGSYDPATGRLQLRKLPGEGPPDDDRALGPAGSLRLPVAADVDGDGKDAVALFDPVTGAFTLAGAGPTDPVVSVPVGASEALPVAGDFDGDGRDEVGVYFPDRGEFLLSRRFAAGAEQLRFRFSPRPLPMYPFAGDFDGDGVDTVGLFEPTSQMMFLRNRNSAGEPDVQLPHAEEAGRWLPVCGRWPRETPPAPDPGYDWEQAPADELAARADRLGQLLERAGQLELLRSLLVLRRGRLMVEQYFHGARQQSRLNVKSVSKSMLSALVGIAIEQRLLTGSQQRLADLIPEQVEGLPAETRQLSLENLLTMTAGLRWHENDPRQDAAWFSSPDWVRFVLERPREHPPGAHFTYSTGLTHVASAGLARASGQRTRVLAERLLFAPAGIRPGRWDVDPGGLEIGGSELHLTARDMARFGQLFLQKGELDGRQIVPPAWVAETTRPRSPGDPALGTHGAWWWQRTVAGQQLVFAAGYGGQFIFIAPALDAVIVLTSHPDDGRALPAHYLAVFRLLEQQVLPALLP